MLLLFYLIYFLILLFDANLFNLSRFASLISSSNHRPPTTTTSHSARPIGADRNSTKSDQIDDDEHLSMRIVFVSSKNTTLTQCILQPVEAVFKCDSPARAIFCKLSINTTSLVDKASSSDVFSTAKLCELGSSLVRPERRHDVAKYGLFPFRLNAEAVARAKNGDEVVFDYVSPVYGSWNVLALFYEKMADVYRLDLRDISCFSQLISLLNESSSSVDST